MVAKYRRFPATHSAASHRGPRGSVRGVIFALGCRPDSP